MIAVNDGTNSVVGQVCKIGIVSLPYPQRDIHLKDWPPLRREEDGES